MPDERAAHYPDAPDKPSFPAIEEGVLASWKADGTFEASIKERPASNEFVFYDGPPFANGLPHYGHLLTGFVKDVVPRYRTMRGQRVERRFGWDCHGLPAETEAEKQLGVSGRGPITEFGIDRFNAYCQESVLRYTREWRDYVTRQARWVDFDNDYKTMDPTFMESVMWAFKRLHDKGLLYEAYRVLPYCWECETPLSNSETRQDDAYRDRQDPATTVAFSLAGSDSRSGERGLLGAGTRLWVWTTTPWTLPSNLALAVGPDLDYAVFDLPSGERVVLGEGTVEAYSQQLEDASRVGTVKGSDLAGRSYKPLFPFFAGHSNAFVVLGADFVATDEGTGVVHLAPGFGEDDQAVCASAGISVVCPVDSRTRFTSEVPDFEGLQVFEANQPVIRALRASGSVVREDSYVHSYPHCWRSDTPLVYRAVTSWFVNIGKIKDRLVANNEPINWVPAHVKEGAFGKWIEGARDWSISRNRFWGSPIPVWKSDDPKYPRIDVYGSLDEIEADFGVRPTDLHRPAIDSLTRPNPSDPTGKSTMRRVTDVLDCWFESGSMPFAQVHYPFENREWFDSHFPGDFIVEYIGQSKAWFYVLHVMATALFDRPAFSTCVAHGIVLGDDGRKMSKRLRNFPDPEEMFNSYGADAMRWYFMSSPIVRGGDLVVDEKGIRGGLRQALLPLWNAWYFFTLYANADKRRADLSRLSELAKPSAGRHSAGRHGASELSAGRHGASELSAGRHGASELSAGRHGASELGAVRHGTGGELGVLDRYILAKAHQLVADTTEAMDAYDMPRACGHVESFLDALDNWYIRRSRDRFWGTGSGGSSASGAGAGGSGAGGSSSGSGAGGSSSGSGAGGSSSGSGAGGSSSGSGAGGSSQDAFDTLATVLEVLCRLAAPLAPMVTEEVWRGLTGGRSVHLTDWPSAGELPADSGLVAAMDRVREVCSAAHSVRKDRRLRARLPLASLTVAGRNVKELEPFVDLIADEVNVKEVVLTEEVGEYAEQTVTVVFKVCAPRLGPATQNVARAAKAGDWELLSDGRARIGGEALEPGEFDMRLVPADPKTTRVLTGGTGVVVLDTDVPPELEAEGLARDLVRVVQNLRRDSGLDVSDRISLEVAAPADLVDTFRHFLSYISEQTLAVSSSVVALADSRQHESWTAAELAGETTVRLRLAKQ